MSEIQKEMPQYEIHFLNVGDADSIAIKYRKDNTSRAYVALIDAGNVTDAPKIKKFLKNQFGTLEIDLAVCTHPDKDHKGGFFDLLEDQNVSFREFWWKNPRYNVSADEFVRMSNRESMQTACERIYDHPNDNTKNLLNLARGKINQDGTKCKCRNVKEGDFHAEIPLTVLGPDEGYYTEVALGIVQNFAELEDDPDTTPYDMTADVSEKDACGVIDQVEDESETNKGSLVLYFSPGDGRKILLTGDASSTSIHLAYEAKKELLDGCILKVPHHGSKHNLNSKLIDELKPSAAIISAAGTRKHPNPAIVRYLSKYCNVFSTHFSGDLSYTSYPYGSEATPLKAKCS